MRLVCEWRERDRPRHTQPQNTPSANQMMPGLPWLCQRNHSNVARWNFSLPPPSSSSSCPSPLLDCAQIPNPPMSASLPFSFPPSPSLVPLLSQSAHLPAPPSLHSADLFLLARPRHSSFPASYPICHPLSTYPPPSSSPFSSSARFPACNLFHSQITQECSVAVPLSAIPLSLSLVVSLIVSLSLSFLSRSVCVSRGLRQFPQESWPTLSVCAGAGVCP